MDGKEIEIFRKIDTIDREIYEKKKRMEALSKIKSASISEIHLLEIKNPGISTRVKSCNDEMLHTKASIIDEIIASIGSLENERKSIVKDSFPFLKDVITRLSFYVFVISPEGLKKFQFVSMSSGNKMPRWIPESDLLSFRMLGSAALKHVKPEYWNFTVYNYLERSFERRISSDYSVDVLCHDLGFSYVEQDSYGVLHVEECEDTSITDKHVEFLRFDYSTFASNSKIVKDLFLKVLDSSTIKIHSVTSTSLERNSRLIGMSGAPSYKMVSDGVYFVGKRDKNDWKSEVLWRAERDHGCKTKVEM